MRYKKFAALEESVSQLGLGCWGFSGSSVWDNSDDERTIRVIREAIDRGVNFIDVAPVYGKGHSEEIVGRVLKEGLRQKVLLATKCGLVWKGEEDARNNLKRESIFREVEDSLKRLQTDVIDIYQLHWPDPDTELEETIGAIEELKKQGKIRYFGMTNFSLSDIRRANTITTVNTVQGLYNMLEQNPTAYHNIPLEYRTRDEILPYCQEKDIPFLPYSPLFQGLLTGKFRENNNFSDRDVRNANPKLVGPVYSDFYKIVERLKNLAAEWGHPLNEVAINWLARQKMVGPIIAGATKVEQFCSNCQAMEWELNQEQFDILENTISEMDNALTKIK